MNNFNRRIIKSRLLLGLFTVTTCSHCAKQWQQTVFKMCQSESALRADACLVSCPIHAAAHDDTDTRSRWPPRWFAINQNVPNVPTKAIWKRAGNVSAQTCLQCDPPGELWCQRFCSLLTVLQKACRLSLVPVILHPCPMLEKCVCVCVGVHVGLTDTQT